MRAHHLAIVVHDVARVAAFYRDVLRLEALSAPREGVAWFALGELILMIEPASAPREGASDVADVTQPRTGLHLLALAIDVSERSVWEQRLRDHGVPIETRSAFTLYIRDPEGNRLGLSHYPAAAEGVPSRRGSDE